MARFDPRGQVNRALLVGVSEYENTETPHGVPDDLPAVEHNLIRLHRALRAGGMFRDEEITVCRSPSLDDFNDVLERAADAAEGLLLFYFAGHGAIPSAADQLFLQMRNARVVAGGHAVFRGADAFTDVLTVLAGSRARRVVVILDCCFAGNAAQLWEAESDWQRVLLLMGVQANHRVDMGDEATPTPFTDRLVRVLERGGTVSFRDLEKPLWTYMQEHHRTLRGDPWEPLIRVGRDLDVTLVAPQVGTAEGAAGGTAEGAAPGTAGDAAAGTAEGAAGGMAEAAAGSTAEGGGGGAEDEGTRSLLSPAPQLSLEAPSGPGFDESSPPPGRKPGWRRRRLAGAARKAGGVWKAGRDAAKKAGDGLKTFGRWLGGLGTVARLMVGALALCVVAALAYGGVTLLAPGRSSCAPPLELRLLTDPDLELTVRAAANAYLTSDGNTDGRGCRRSGITVHSAGAADTVTALHERSSAWQEPLDEDDNPQRDIGPQPDIWIPASTADVDRVTADQDDRVFARLEPAGPPIAYSPIVLAVPQNLARDRLRDRTGRPLSELLADVERQGGQVRRPDPEFTTAALLATTGLYGTGSGTADDVGGAERQVAQSGPPSSTAADLLCTLPDDDEVDDRTAALVPEFLLTSGVGCDRSTRTARMAEYPDDVPGLEPTFVRVRWEGAERDEPDRGEAISDFRTWLTGKQGLEVFARAGFRAASGDRALLGTEHGKGILTAPRPLARAAGPETVDAALDAYRSAGGSGRVLFLLDSSGSMGSLWEGPSGGPGILKQSLGGLGDQDEYGVWAVASAPGADRPHSVLLPFGRHPRDAAERTIDDKAVVRDAEADPHAALLAALDDMSGRGNDDERPQLIVYLTDDEDNERMTGRDLDEVLQRARSAKVPVTMVSLENGGCDSGRPDARISEASGGRCLDTDDDLGAGLQDEVARTGTGDD
ncbi:vWA domain-containing protein [Streptomyces cavernae]|uniref:vWA domain-containing protein n=1 Tax=Streptomyces cavernae TaxID=2259034 RepID=UPI001EE4BFD3|nr:substrate-binding domain-containing protein [Streptomyces cavernae]